VLILADIGLSRAVTLCERVRKTIEDFDWNSIAPGLRVTASIGVADTAAHADPEEGLRRVDACMYQAKQRGRNQVVAPA